MTKHAEGVDMAIGRACLSSGSHYSNHRKEQSMPDLAESTKGRANPPAKSSQKVSITGNKRNGSNDVRS